VVRRKVAEIVQGMLRQPNEILRFVLGHARRLHVDLKGEFKFACLLVQKEGSECQRARQQQQQQQEIEQKKSSKKKTKITSLT
jgi:hypothetical protein